MILFTQRTCRPCMELKIWLRGQGIDFTEKYIDEDEEAREQFDSMGLMGTPAILAGDMVLTGNNPETKETILKFAK